MDELLQQGANSLVFDLRDNTGENLNAALVAADYCVPSGEIAKQQDRDGNVTVLRMSDETEINVPIVCLVNGSTAGSAAAMRLSFVITPSFSGTLKSQRTRTFFPATSISSTVFFFE